MQITSINISNYLGVKSLVIEKTSSVLMISGFNGAGKSSVAAAIRHALQNKFERVEYKKDLFALLNNEADHGHVIINTDVGEYGATLPAGDVAGDFFALSPALPFTLDPGSFARMDASDRRRFLFKLMKVNVTAEAISKRLIEGGAAASLVDQIRPHLAGGFEAAKKECDDQARDEKTAWRMITGETYGEKKAETWELPVPDFGGNQIDPSHLKAADDRINELNLELGALVSKKQAAEVAARDLNSSVLKIDQLRTSAKKFAAIQDEINQLNIQKAQAEKSIADLESALKQVTAPPLACPHCAGLVEYGDNHQLIAYEGEAVNAQEIDETNNLIADQKERLQSIVNKLDVLDFDLKVADRAANELAVAENAAAVSLVDPASFDADIEAAKLEIAQATKDRDSLRSEDSALKNARRNADGIKANNANAKQAHCNVKAWLAISAMLAPEGIPADLLNEAIEPFNQMLSDFSFNAKWMKVQLNSNIEIEINGRAYALRSESEQWRADAVIAATVAKISGAGVVMLDRFDVLDLPGRSELISWLGSWPTEMSAIVLGTMKKAPENMPGFIQSVWLERV